MTYPHLYRDVDPTLYHVWSSSFMDLILAESATGDITLVSHLLIVK